MMPPSPVDEAERLHALRAYEVLDTPPEEAFDRVTHLAARIFGVPISLVSLVEEDRQFFKACVGLDVNETPRSVSFCAHAILDDGVMVVEDAHEDPRFADNPVVTGAPHVRFYAGAPLEVRPGVRFGTLCIIDRVPRRFNDADREMLKDLAAVVVDALSLRKEVLERREVEATLRASERKSQALLRGIPDALFRLDRSGRCLDVSASRDHAVMPVLGDPVGRTLQEVLPSAPAHRAIHHLERAFDTGEITRFEYNYNRPDKACYFEVRFLRESDATALAVVRDITALRLRERELEQANRKLRALTENIPGVIYQFQLALDGSMSFPYVSPAIEAILGLTPDTLRQDARVAMDRIHAEDRPSLYEGLRTSAEHLTPFRWEGRLRKEHEIRWVHVASVPSRMTDGTTMWNGVMTDVTQQKHDAERLEEALRKERELVELRTRFIAMASHEFRTPLAMIRSSAQIAQRLHRFDSAKTEKHLDRIQEGVGEMTELLEGVLTLGRSNAGKMAFQPQQVNLPMLLDAIVRDVHQGIGRAHRLEVSACNTPDGLVVDPNHVRLVLGNFLANAVKYSEPGTTVTLRCDHDDTHVRFSVTDQGMGIPEADLPHLFESFYRSSQVQTIQGTGLGLAIAQQSAELHGGTLRLESQLGQGTTAIFEIPCLSAASCAKGGQAHRPSEPA
ncbi:MAG: ATP-binding protein [Bacteroidota bacterium]